MISDRICQPNTEPIRSNKSSRQRVGVIVRLAMAWLLAEILLLSSIAVGQDSQKVLKSAWYPWDPYQYVLAKHDIKRLTGLDIQLIRAVFAQMGYEVAYEEVSWKQHQSDIRNGVRDIAAGAFKNPERAEYAYFSAPYRKETDVLYVRKGEASKTRATLRADFKSNRFVWE
jgi:polar amino acid transport system substrate-binding protein